MVDKVYNSGTAELQIQPSLVYFISSLNTTLLKTTELQIQLSGETRVIDFLLFLPICLFLADYKHKQLYIYP
jgi:hypothetical protein